MTFKTMVEQVYERIPDIIENEMEDWGVVEQVVNEALQRMYAVAITMYPAFYTRSVPLAAATSFAQPADFYQIVTVYAQGANRAGVRVLNHRDVETNKLNQVLAPTSSKPIAIVEHTTIEFTPAVTGTLWYLWTFGYISDETQELTDPSAAAQNNTLAVLPSIFEEEAIRVAVDLMRERYQLKDDTEDDADQPLETLAAAMAKFESERQPAFVYNKDVSFGG